VQPIIEFFNLVYCKTTSGIKVDPTQGEVSDESIKKNNKLLLMVQQNLFKLKQSTGQKKKLEILK